MLYDPAGVPAPSGSVSQWESDLTKIAGPLRLAAKYELEGLFTRLADVLKATWPEDLHAWTKRTETIQSWRHTINGKSLLDLGLVSHPDPWRAIDLATSASIPSVLPAAFYDLHVQTSLVSAVANELGGPARPNDPYLVWDKTHDRFTASQIWQLTRGREWLRLIVTRFMTTTLPAELKRQYGECTQSQACQVGKDNVLKISSSHARYNELYNDPLWGLYRMKKDVWRELEQMNMCATCGSWNTSTIEGLRDYIWAEMPYFFGLEERKDGSNYGYRDHIPPFF
ncbi:hypothetical protein BDW22DRAFT_913409 [Trametopsis cervina]|nr:hypothetical protein BDW22DRAFT_913409 [Trametopsis cervina]